jgi:hypothetical protein
MTHVQLTLLSTKFSTSWAFYCHVDAVLHARRRSATSKTHAQAPSSCSYFGGDDDDLKLIAPQTNKPTASHHKTI